MQRKYRADIGALLAYLTLALILTYPLIIHFGTHVPGDGSDDPALVWNLWWVPYAILNLGQSPIYTQHMFYPIGLNLAFYTLTYLNALLAIPFQFAFGLVVAANVNLTMSFALGGFGTWLLVKYLLHSQEHSSRTVNYAAFAAGALYAFSSNKFMYAALGQFNIASSHWIPFYILFLIKLTRHRRIYFSGTLLGLFLLFQALSEFIYASFLIIFTVLYFAYWLVFHRHRLRALRQLVLAFLLAALVFLIPMSPILAALVEDTVNEGDFIQRGLGFADVFSNDALGFLVPSHLHPFFGSSASQFHFAYLNFAFLGYGALVLGLVAALKVPRARAWILFGAIFMLISLGPNLRVNGEAISAPYLPFNLLLEIPFVKGNRYPSRWGVMVTLALAVLVGYGVNWVITRVISRPAAAAKQALLPITYYLLVGVLLFEHLSLPLPISNLRVPEVYQTIAQDRGDFTVLEIPLAWRNGFRMTGTLDQAMMFAQFYQTQHRRAILGGNTSRNPEFKFQYFTEAPVINSIIAVETGHTLAPEILARDRELAPDVLNFFGVRYVIWHSPRNPQNRFALDAARAYVENILPVEKFYQVSDDMGEIVAYRVRGLTNRNPTTVRSNDVLARLHFGEGWGTLDGETIWVSRREARIFLRLDAARAATISFRALAPIPNRRLALYVNGHRSGQVALKQEWAEYVVGVAADAWREGMNEIVLQFDALAPVANARQADFKIGSVQSPASIIAYSAGSEMGDFAHIFVNGINFSLNARGYNVVVVDPQTGEVESRGAFDTFASEENSTRLAQFISRTPEGKIIALAVRDEAARFLNADAVGALQSLGATVDLRGTFRWSHAAIGVKGAMAALERASEIAPAQVVVGIGALEPNVAAAFEWIKIAPR